MPLLFGYGTLQDASVQQALFGQLLLGQPDELVGFERTTVTIEGAAYYTVRPVERDDDRVPGLAFDVTDDELERVDQYEGTEYRRVMTRLASGREAWVYIDARDRR